MISINPRTILSFIFAPILCSCASMGISTYLPDTFTTENVMKVRQGMSSDEISKMFGNPKSVGQAVCGAGSDAWTCITWEYGKFPYDRASFTFNGDTKPNALNNFKIEKKGRERTLPDTFTTDNIMKVHQGVGSDEILKTFGPPKGVHQAVCGAATGHAWTCTTWEYGNFPYERAHFTFADKNGSMILNDFKVEKKD